MKVAKKISKNVKSSINSLSNMGFIFMAILILLGAYLIYKYLTRKVESFSCFYEGFGTIEKPDDWKILDTKTNKEMKVERIETLPNGTKVYMIKDGDLVKLVTNKDDAYSYKGKIDDFNQSNMGIYTKLQAGLLQLKSS